MIRRNVPDAAYPELAALPKRATVDRIFWHTRTFTRKCDAKEYDLATWTKVQGNPLSKAIEEWFFFADSDDDDDIRIQFNPWLYSDNVRGLVLATSSNGNMVQVKQSGDSRYSKETIVHFWSATKADRLLGACGDTVFIAMVDGTVRQVCGSVNECSTVLPSASCILVSVSERVTVVVPLDSSEPLSELVLMDLRLAWLATCVL
jgi:hypothetical protein